MLSTWKSSQPPGEKAVETLKLVWDSVQSVKKADNIEEDEDTSTVLKQAVVERDKQNELVQEQLKIIDFSVTDDPSGSSCKQGEIHEDLDKHGGIPSTGELRNVAHQIKTLQTARSLGKALRIDDITILSYVTQQSHSLLHETAQQILRMWQDGLQEGVKEVELHKLLVKYNISGDTTGGFTEIAKLIRSEADLVGLIHHLDVQPTTVLEVINTSTGLTPHIIIPLALKMLIEWSKKGGTRERLLAISQAFRFLGVDLLVKGLACHSSYQYFISYGIIDHKGGKLTLDVLGIALSIPKGAIPKGMLLTVTLRVSFRNIRRLPMHDDEVLITPVIETSLTQELLKPASIVLPHCMGFKNDDSTIVMYTKTGQGKFGRRILTGDDLRISKSTIEFCTHHIEVLAVCSTDLRDLQLTCFVLQPTMKSPVDHPSLRVYVIHPYKAYTQDIIMRELTSSVPYCQVEKEFKFSIGSKSKHLTVICHEETKQQNQMIPLSGVLNGQCSPVVFTLQFTPKENVKKNVRITIKERDEPISDRVFNVSIEDEPNYTINRRVSEGRLSCLSNNLIETLADVILKQSDADSLGGYLGFSESIVKQYLDRSDSSYQKFSRSGFVEMLSDWRRRVRPSEQVKELHRALKDAGLGYVTDTILPGDVVVSNVTSASTHKEEGSTPESREESGGIPKIICLEKHGIEVRIPASDTYSSSDITVEVIEDVPPELKIRETEAIITYGLKVKAPSNAIFEHPIQVTMPHSGIFTKPKNVEIISYYRKRASEEFVAIHPIRGTNHWCVVRQRDLDIFFKHFCEYWFVAVYNMYTRFKEIFIGKRLVCTPYVPMPPFQSGERVLFVNVRDANTHEEKFFKLYEHMFIRKD
ncbi:uncharacterized protein LOC121421169 [Lytechinus variegatus]|uniref:uncharacterized protein LOC121421169 n=1 Tax=Lytechinus variegatus TaxID=7654 RepID=UPI001BB204A8|nr:uncharacterized protein LOC121421169 [Lytechinus variegatus]